LQSSGVVKRIVLRGVQSMRPSDSDALTFRSTKSIIVESAIK
jgi:hypothetical protein